MREKDSPSAVVSETNSPETTLPSTEEDVQRHWQGVVKRRSFLKGLGIAGAALSAGTLLTTEGAGQTSSSTGKLSKGDIALLQFAAWAEIVESDLWTQYAELGGVGPSGGGAVQSSEEFQKFIGGNPAYNLALQNLDGDMPQYITDNTDDELSHAAFLKAFLKSRGVVPVDLEPFRKLPSSKATFPNLNNPATELTQTNKILPEPCDFISKNLPRCSVIRPTSTQNGGAVATVRAFTEDGLFIGQPDEFFELSMNLAVAADSVQREF